MELSRDWFFDQKGTGSEAIRSQQGFALVSLLSLVPLLFTLLSGLGLALYAFKKKSLAQSLCVRAGLQLQADLARSLTELLRLNVKATSLRRRRAVADHNLNVALASGNPKAIAIAKAAQAAVILEQLHLRGRQERIFTEASKARYRHARDLRGELRPLGATAGLQSDSSYFRPLAVRPEPPTSPSPNYSPVPTFVQAQSHRFRFQVDLAPPDLPLPFPKGRFRQITECSITLEKEAPLWKPRILGASARLSY